MRRRTGQVLISAAVLGVLALVVSAVGVVPGLPWADADTAAVDGYPERVARPYVVRDLPARPGALAGLVRADDGWLAVSPEGRLWELADDDEEHEVTPALSADGRLLAYLRDAGRETSEYVVRNLTSGVLTAIPDVGSTASGSEAEFFVTGRQPAFFSPDGRRVLVAGGRTDARDADALVVSLDRGVRELYVAGEVQPAGWLSDDGIAWLTRPRGDGEPARTPELVGTTDTGTALGRVRLELPGRRVLGRWSASVAPDGDVLAVAGEDPATGRQDVTLYSLPDGEELDRVDLADDATLLGCPPSWRGDELLTPASGGRALVDPGGSAVVVADTRLATACSLWATQALAGDAHGGLTGSLFGTSESSWTWRWREIGVALLLGLAALGVWLGRPRGTGG